MSTHPVLNVSEEKARDWRLYGWFGTRWKTSPQGKQGGWINIPAVVIACIPTWLTLLLVRTLCSDEIRFCSACNTKIQVFCGLHRSGKRATAVSNTFLPCQWIWHCGCVVDVIMLMASFIINQSSVTWKVFQPQRLWKQELDFAFAVVVIIISFAFPM